MHRFTVGWTAIVTLAALLTLSASGCAVVPKNRRRYLADPTMQGGTRLEEAARHKLHTAREGAAGADGQPAGGGCGCGN